MDDESCRMPVFSLDSSFSQDGQLMMNPRTLELDSNGGQQNNEVHTSEYYQNVSQVSTREEKNMQRTCPDYDTIDNGGVNGFPPAMSENSLLSLEQLLLGHTSSKQDVQMTLQRSISDPVSTYSMACDLKTNLVSSSGTGSIPELNPVSPSLSEILNQNSVERYLHDTHSYNHFPSHKSPTIAELLTSACSPTKNNFTRPAESPVCFTKGQLNCEENLNHSSIMLVHQTGRNGSDMKSSEYDQQNCFEGGNNDLADCYHGERTDSPSSDRNDSPSPYRKEAADSPLRERDDPNLMEDDARDEPSIQQDPIDIREYVEVLTTYKCKFCQFNCSDTAIMASHIQAAHTAEVKKCTQNEGREKNSNNHETAPAIEHPQHKATKKQGQLYGSEDKEKVPSKKIKKMIKKPDDKAFQPKLAEVPSPQTVLKSHPPDAPKKVIKKRKLAKVKPILPKPASNGGQAGPPSTLATAGPPSVLGPPPSVLVPPPSVHPPSNLQVQVQYDLQRSPEPESHSKESQVFVCGVCRAFFLQEEDCSSHVNSVHNSNNGPVRKETEEGVVFGCNIPPCKRTFKTIEACEFHISCHVTVRKRQSDQDEEYGKKSKAKKTKRMFACPTANCKASFMYWQNCAQHAWTEHKIDTGLLCCEECNNYRTMSKFNMKMHQETHNNTPHEKTFECTECRKSFSSKTYLDVHTKNIHHPEIYTCAQCGDTMGSQQSLKNHQLTHSEEKPFSCSVCSFKTKRKTDLNLHEKQQHDPEKMFSCETCNYKTSDSSQMFRHKAAHAKHKKYKCPYCTIAFVQCVNLKKHIGNIHPGLPMKMYKCGQCNFKSRAEEMLEKHLRDRKHLAGLTDPSPEATLNSQPEVPLHPIPVNGTGSESQYQMLVSDGEHFYVVKTVMNGNGVSDSSVNGGDRGNGIAVRTLSEISERAEFGEVKERMIRINGSQFCVVDGGPHANLGESNGSVL